MSSFSVPEPRLRSARNSTPFVMFQCDKMGAGRRFYDTVVFKGTYVLAPGRLVMTEEQADLVMADEVWDPANAERSSLKKAGEVVLTKPTTDVIVTGTARAPGGTPLPSWSAAVEVRRGGEIKIACHAQALGPRRFRHAAGGWGLTDPEPTLEVPLRYELAYGGAYAVPPQEGAPAEPTWVVHHPNPSGTGFFDERALDTAREYPAPQWQLPPYTSISTPGRSACAGGSRWISPSASRSRRSRARREHERTTHRRRGGPVPRLQHHA